MATREETKRMIEVMQAYVDGASIQVKLHHGYEWRTCYNDEPPIWNWNQQYRIAKPKTRKVKLLAWYDGEELRHFDKSFTDANTPYANWKRVPSEDKEIEIEE